MLAAAGLLLAAFAATAAASPTPVAVTASTPEDPDDRFAASHTIDGDFSTRWSSAHSEPHWIAWDFGEPVELVGLRLHWETAYGRDYDIEVSDDGEEWETAYKWREGSGGVDEVYFGLRETRHVRMYGIRRATGWGFSIFQTEFLGPEALRTFEASAEGTDGPPEAIMNGDPDSGWAVTRAPGQPRPWIQVNFPEVTAFGGLAINWTDGAGTPWSLLAREQTDGEWAEIGRSPGGDELEEMYLEATEAISLRIELHLGEGASAGLGEVQLKGPDETWNPTRHFEMLARRLPNGAFPWWLRREQGFFNVIGRPRAHHVSLMDEDGRIEPVKDAFSVTPLLVHDGRLLTARNFETDQTLLDGWAPVPAAHWFGEDVNLRVEAADGSDHHTDVLYTVMNPGAEEWEGALVLALRPLQINPPWQRGGFSAVNEAYWDGTDGVLDVNGSPAMLFSPVPETGGVHGRDDHDVAELLARGETLARRAEDEDGLVSAGWRHDLQLGPGEEFRLLVRYSLDGSVPVPVETPPWAAFDQIRREALQRWSQATGDWELDAPDPRLEPFVRSNLAYLLVNMDGPAIQPGTRNYQHSWIRDGSISATAMLFFGLEEPVRDYVRWMTTLVEEDGFVRFLVDAQTGEMAGWTADWKEYDSFGQYAYLVREFVEVTGDRALAEEAWPRVRAAMNKAARLRTERTGPEWEGTEFEGILPESNSHEGYFPAAHSYWDVFSTLRGHADAAWLAELLGMPDEAEHFRREEELLREGMLISMQRVREIYGLDTIPASADLGDFDPTSTSIGIMFADERDTLPSAELHATFDRYIEEARERARGGDLASSYTAYEGRNVGALLRLDRKEEALWLMDWLLEDATRPPGWNHMGEVTHPDPRQPAYIGDMPHTWVGSGVIHAIRDMFLYEDRDALVLAAGVTPEWFEEGVGIGNWTTRWGAASYRLEMEDGFGPVLRLEIERTPPNGFRVPEGVTLFVNGRRE